MLRRHAQGTAPLIRELYKNPLPTLSEDIDLLDARDMEELLTDLLRLTHERPHRHALSLQRIEGECDIGVLVVHERAERTGRQVASLIAQLLASLVELLRNLTGRRI